MVASRVTCSLGKRVGKSLPCATTCATRSCAFRKVTCPLAHAFVGKSPGAAKLNTIVLHFDGGQGNRSAMPAFLPAHSSSRAHSSTTSSSRWRMIRRPSGRRTARCRAWGSVLACGLLVEIEYTSRDMKRDRREGLLVIAKTIEGQVENGQLHPKESLDAFEGQQVLVTVKAPACLPPSLATGRCLKGSTWSAMSTRRCSSSSPSSKMSRSSIAVPCSRASSYPRKCPMTEHYPWYGTASGEPLEQGDFLRKTVESRGGAVV